MRAGQCAQGASSCCPRASVPLAPGKPEDPDTSLPVPVGRDRESEVIRQDSSVFLMPRSLLRGASLVRDDRLCYTLVAGLLSRVRTGDQVIIEARHVPHP